MKKILFPTDYSETSNNAFLHALNLANIIKGKVTTLHVTEMPLTDINPIGATMFNTYEMIDSLEMIAENKHREQIELFEKLANQYHFGHVDIEHKHVNGYFLKQVIDVAHEDEFDYIVMGTSGANGLKEFFFGSTTFQVMTHTRAILIGIPEETPFKEIKKIGFATQFAIEELDALRKLVLNSKPLHAQIECVFVKTNLNEVPDIVIEDWKKIFKDDNVRFTIIENELIEETIYHFLQEKNIDLLAMLNHRKGFWESFFHNSLSEKIIHHIKIPVMALHDL